MKEIRYACVLCLFKHGFAEYDINVFNY